MKKVDEDIIFRCSCGESKYLEFGVFHWDEEPKEYYLIMSYEPYGFWYRLTTAWKVFWEGKAFTHEIMLHPKEWKKLEDFFTKHKD